MGIFSRRQRDPQPAPPAEYVFEVTDPLTGETISARGATEEEAERAADELLAQRYPEAQTS